MRQETEGTRSNRKGSGGISDPSRDDRGQVVVGHHLPNLSLSTPWVAKAIRTRAKIKVGNQEKGAVLDLTGLEEHGLKGMDLEAAVNALVRVVRIGGEATVLIDPRERWTACRDLLGLEDDRAYERIGTRVAADGRLELRLRRRKARKEAKGALVVPEGVDAAVVAVRCINRAMNGYEVRGMVAGRPVAEHFTVVSPNKAVGAAMAAAAFLQMAAPSRTVAIAARGQLRVLEEILTSPSRGHANVHFHDAVQALRAWSWRAGGDGLLVGS